MKAKRGDLAVIVSTSHTYVIGSANESRTRVEVWEVTSITRDGEVKAARHVGWDSPPQPRNQWVGFERLYIVPADEVDKPAVIAAVKAHHYPGHHNQPMPFDSLDDVKALIRPHRVKAAAYPLRYGMPRVCPSVATRPTPDSRRRTPATTASTTTTRRKTGR